MLILKIAAAKGGGDPEIRKKTSGIGSETCYNSRSRKASAGVSELADDADSKSVAREGVWVRVPPPAVSFPENIVFRGFFSKCSGRAQIK